MTAWLVFVPFVFFGLLFLALGIAKTSSWADEATEEWERRQGGRGLR